MKYIVTSITTIEKTIEKCNLEISLTKLEMTENKLAYFNGIQAPRCRTNPPRNMTIPTASRMDVVKNITVTPLQ